MRVASLHIYPVKGLRGIDLQESKVEHRGLQYDRRWIITDKRGEFLSQREFAAMARIQTAINEDELVLTAPTGSWVATPLEATDGSTKVVQVWSARVRALHVDRLVDEWLSEFLGMECSLYRMPETARRRINPLYSAGKGIVSFADGMPVLCTTLASLNYLNSKLDTPIPLDRFRSNVVIEGDLEPFEEDGWQKIEIGNAVFFGTKDCGRCLVTTTDQKTGERMGEEPLRTLALIHKRGKAAVFGRYVIPEAEGLVRVGDPVQVRERAAERVHALP